MNLPRLKKVFAYLCAAYTFMVFFTVPWGAKVVPPDYVFIPLFIIFLALVVKERRFGLAFEFLVIFFLIILFMVIDLIFTGNYLPGVIKIVGQCYLFMIFWVFYYYTESKQKLESLFISWFLSGLVLSGLGLLGYILYYAGFHSLLNHLVDGAGLQVSGKYIHVRLSSVIGAEKLSSCLLGVILILVYFFRKKYWKFGNPALFSVLATVLIISDILTLARSFFLLVVALAGYLLIFDEKRNWLTVTLGTAIVTIMLLLTFSLTVWNVFPLHISRNSEKQELRITISTRPSYPRMAVYYPAVWKQIKMHKVWGRGPGHAATGPITVAGIFHPDGGDAHNIIFELWSTRGIFGLILYLAFWLMTIILPIRGFRGRVMPLEAKTLLAISAGIMLVGFTVDVEEFRHLYIALGLFAGFSSPRITDT